MLVTVKRSSNLSCEGFNSIILEVIQEKYGLFPCVVFRGSLVPVMSRERSYEISDSVMNDFLLTHHSYSSKNWDELPNVLTI